MSQQPNREPNRSRGARRRRAAFFAFLAAVAGVISAGALLAVAEAVALLTGRDGSPLLAVGSFVIDIVPRWAKEFAIETFGENDKLFLLVSLGVAVVIAAALAGVLQLVRPPLGLVLVGLAGALAVAAVVTRASAGPLASLPTVIGTLVAVVLLHLLAERLRRWRQTAAPATPDPRDGDEPSREPAVDRRRFLGMAVLTAVGAAVVGTGARIASAATSSIDGIRAALKLPAARSTVTVPQGAEFAIDGLSPLYTPNADFYRVDTALTVPELDPGTWSLKVTGMVDNEFTLSFQDLLDLGLDEYSITLTCVSNEVGGNLLGTAKWLGVPVRTVLERAGVQKGADMVLSTSSDGFTASTPLSSLTDENLDAILAVAMNGEPLPFEHGFPVRMVVPGLYGYVSATKWLTELKATTFADDQAYWTPRGYSEKAPIKLSSRIDTPRVDTPVQAGATKIAGVAWAQPVGVEKVEVSIDDADWIPATLSTPVNDSTWVQWYVDWEATSGVHYVTVRATDKEGKLQVEERAPIAPDGSTGWQRSLVTVS
ncbi:molybdopterin-dependent oxidoreductase [Herbiconiux sp. KACC 21604]|uniref:molybdopterin-dependent oxidoreductase n=1 Tax=unclassified Herbiconiux TaxID=2618217 RepID=UPI0014926F9F|nr:molybdopterin-dependent oxidoreductase [Herbiconiux sp. SALV-R1]QJU52363.1 molybdopterin-dependent oxidoreductase [Herbiconiux sp. SALV-R1]WPO87221.1 molybdopterin-dependent oxidoreductase [Herbiconiux sp. KACC 21604]